MAILVLWETSPAIFIMHRVCWEGQCCTKKKVPPKGKEATAKNTSWQLLQMPLTGSTPTISLATSLKSKWGVKEIVEFFSNAKLVRFRGNFFYGQKKPPSVGKRQKNINNIRMYKDKGPPNFLVAQKTKGEDSPGTTRWAGSWPQFQARLGCFCSVISRPSFWRALMGSVE